MQDESQLRVLLTLCSKKLWICVLWSYVEIECKAGSLLVTMDPVSDYTGNISAYSRCLEHSLVLGVLDHLKRANILECHPDTVLESELYLAGGHSERIL